MFSPQKAQQSRKRRGKFIPLEKVVQPVLSIFPGKAEKSCGAKVGNHDGSKSQTFDSNSRTNDSGKMDHPAGRGWTKCSPLCRYLLIFENVHRNDKPGQNKPDCQNGNLVIRHYKEKAVAYIEQRPFSIIRQGTRSNLSRMRTP